MDLKDLDTISELKRELEEADRIVAAFQALPGPTARVYASSADGRLYRGPEKFVELLPVDKSVAVSAAQRVRSKIVEKLQQLGVTVS